MENNLPKGWIETTFDDVADATDYVANGSFESLRENVKTTDKKDYAILVRLRDYNRNWNQDELVYVDKSSYEFLSKSCLKEGDLFIANVGAPGKSFIVPDLGQPMTIGPNGLRIRANAATTNKFLFYYYNSPQGLGEIEKLIAGSAQQKFNKTGLRSSLFLLPPLPEQQRIVEKLDALMARISNSKARLEKIPSLLKNFRQSVLAAAVSGELTKEWRENDEVGDGNLYEEDLPTGWKLLKLNEITIVKDGTHDSPKYVNEGIPFITQKNIRETGLDFSNIRYITQVDHDKFYKRSDVSANDILFSMIGANRGMTCIVEDKRVFSIKNVGLIKSNEEKVETKYLLYFFKSTFAEAYIQSLSKGNAQEFVGLTELRNFPTVFPPLEEQKEIVRKVEELFHFANSIEARYQKAKAWFDKLPQAILAKAFRGELVPQNEEDEPASELLKRIQNEKHSITKTPKPAALKTKAKKYRIDEDEGLSMVAEG